MPTGFENCENALEVKKSKCENHQMSTYNIQHDEGIPNLASELKLDNICPFPGQKTVENWDFLKHPYFRQFFIQKGVRCYPIWILRQVSESFHHFGYYRPPFDMIFTFWFFTSSSNVFSKFSKPEGKQDIKKLRKWSTPYCFHWYSAW